MSNASRSGIQTTADGSAFIPASKRSDGSTRKEIRVRPGYKPPEDVDAYKNRTAEAWRTRGKGGVPGADPVESSTSSESKSQNAKRREAARRNKAISDEKASPIEATKSDSDTKAQIANNTTKGEILQEDASATGNSGLAANDDAETQKKIRNLLKKLKGVREMKEKKAAGEKLSPDQIMRIGREGELIRDLKRLGHDEDAAVNESTTGIETT